MTKVLLVNHGAATGALKGARARARWYARRRRLVLEVLAVRADVIGGLECGGTKRPNPWHYLSTKYRQADYQLVPGGRGGRHLWADREHVNVRLWGAFDPPRARDGDDKPAPWLLGTVRGDDRLVVLAHFDPTDATGVLQARQARHVVTKARDLARRHGLEPEAVTFLVDTATTTNRVRETFRDAGYVDAFTVADRSSNAHLKSANGYRRPRRGARVDAVFVHRDSGVRVVSQRPTTATDHHLMPAVLERNPS